MKKSLLKWFRKRKDILDHNLNTVYSLPCDCSYCSKTLIGPSDSEGWAISGMSRQNSARDSGKKRQASPLTNRPEKKHEGFFERPSLLSQMASRDPNEWPLPGGQGEDQPPAAAGGQNDFLPPSGGGAAALPVSGGFTPPNNQELGAVIQQMHQELGFKAEDDATEESYLSKAKKIKRFYPYTVFIVAGETVDLPLTQRHYVAFEEFIWQKRIKLSMEENEKLTIEWMSFHNSYAIAACESKETGLWVKASAHVFKWEDKTTRAFFAWERRQSVVFGVFLKGPMWKQRHMKPNWVLGKIFQANGLIGDFKNVSYDTKRNPGGVWLEFEPVGSELESKLNSMTVLNCLTCKPFLNRRIRKEKSEETFIQGLLKDPALKDVHIAGHT